ncbi:MAG: helix-turn-helix transcriptional regulator [Blautia sp.]|nr:helix-turn-helix transcriptional regulator [Blautia sp.]
MDQKKIGNFLKELRRQKGITQEQLAEELGVSGRTVSRWETGSNMPDISLLIEISEFYDMSIPEIVDGERKSEMNEEVREVAEKMSDYAVGEKESLVKNIRQMSIVGAIALIIYEVIEVLGLAQRGVVLEHISTYLQTLVFVTVLLMPLYTTGLIQKIRGNRKAPVKLSRPVQVVLSVVVAFALAFLVKMFLTRVLGM